MKQYRFMEYKAGKIAFGVFLFLMLYLARDTLVTSSLLGFTKAQLLMLGILCVFGFCFLVVNRRELKNMVLDRRMGMILFFAVILLLPMVVKREWQLMYFSILIGAVVAVFLTYFTNTKEAAKYYVVIMTVLGVFSVLAAYILRPALIDTGIIKMPYVRNPIKIGFHYFGLSFVSNSYVKNRNFGIFREPGVYQYFLILALYLHNYILTWDKQWKYWTINICLAVTMLTTFATGGVAEMGLLALVVFFDKKMYRDKRIVTVVLLLIVLMAVLLGFIIAEQGSLYWELYSMVVSKFSPQEESFWERAEAVVMDTQFFLQNPIFGEKLSTVLHAVRNNTTSTLIMFAAFGIPGGILHVVTWMVLIWDKDRKLWVNLLMIPVLFLSFNTQNLTADVFFWLFPCMALTEKVLPHLNFPKRKV